MISLWTKPVLKLCAVSLLATSVYSAPTRASAGIENDEEVFARLLITAIAHEVRENCETISARKITATFYVLGIVRYANGQGYSRAEIDEFRFDPAEQDRLRQATYVYFDENGVDRSDATSYCAFGQAEMAKKSQIGRLLK